MGDGLVGQKVLVTTHRGGVFGGELVAYDPAQCAVVVLRAARMAVRFKGTKSVLGLASHGPGEECRISRPVPGDTTVADVTMVCPIVDAAWALWEQEPWAR